MISTTLATTCSSVKLVESMITASVAGTRGELARVRSRSSRARSSASTAASGAVAASKKAGESLASAGTPVDPRDAYLAKRKSNSFLTWCDTDPSCNGWGEWQRLVSAGKIKP